MCGSGFLIGRSGKRDDTEKREWDDGITVVPLVAENIYKRREGLAVT